VLSDTHGKLDRRVFDLFEGVDAIIHAGDVGDWTILNDLSALACTVAVLGNVDQGGDCRSLPLNATEVFGGLKVFVTHGHLQADPSQRIARILETTRDIAPDLVVVGHSHRPHVGVYGGVTFLNPGSASRPRHGHPPTVALVTARERKARIRLVDMDGNDVDSDAKI